MILERGRPVKSQFSGASSDPLPSDLPAPLPRAAAAGLDPQSHGLLVALVSAADAPAARLPTPAWPLWLVPRVSRRGNRTVSRHLPTSGE